MQFISEQPLLSLSVGQNKLETEQCNTESQC